MVSRQWFVSMKELAKPAIGPCAEGMWLSPSGLIKFIITGWKMSATGAFPPALVGHRIPAYYCDECGDGGGAGNAENLRKNAAVHFHQDEACWIPGSPTLALSPCWLFSDKTGAGFFYPTSVLVTDTTLSSSGWCADDYLRHGVLRARRPQVPTSMVLSGILRARKMS